MPIKPDRFLPVELVFNPNWWYHTAGISFDEKFYLDIDTRIQNDVTMRRVLHERFGALGLGEANPQPRPIIGSMHVAGGFVIRLCLAQKFALKRTPRRNRSRCIWCRNKSTAWKSRTGKIYTR